MNVTTPQTTHSTPSLSLSLSLDVFYDYLLMKIFTPTSTPITKRRVRFAQISPPSAGPEYFAGGKLSSQFSTDKITRIA